MKKLPPFSWHNKNPGRLSVRVLFLHPCEMEHDTHHRREHDEIYRMETFRFLHPPGQYQQDRSQYDGFPLEQIRNGAGLLVEGVFIREISTTRMPAAVISPTEAGRSP